MDDPGDGVTMLETRGVQFMGVSFHVSDKSERMHQAISHSEMLVIASAGHSSSVEKPVEVTQALQKFISNRQSP